MINQKKTHIKLFLTGLLMGLADLMPGISGGTIAFISGIYEILLSSLKSFNITVLKLIWQGELKQAWYHINGHFLLPLVCGIICSIVLFAPWILILLKNKQTWLYAFFFGLMMVSTIILIRKTPLKTKSYWISLLSSAVCMLLMIQYMPYNVHVVESPPFFLYFIGGAIAMCAMILPGISGSFILILLGLYQPILEALTTWNFAILSSFITGCMIGLFVFSHLLQWLLSQASSIIFGILTGFMLGGLYQIFPFNSALDVNSVYESMISMSIGLLIVPFYFSVMKKSFKGRKVT
ncbi:MAG: DUF368 domain-containing protein [Endozoicomonadaceae bacterium]|nr:DUF368 domain-containing protein [Endozoicomonadaceae bacterium]